jgi:hypothetical protein
MRLRDSGLRWEPESGDRFAIPGPEFAGEVFVVSEMTIDSIDVGTGRLIRFNGTTEWALDSIAAERVVWLPHEAQLRALLGPAFTGLRSEPGGYVVGVMMDGVEQFFAAGDAECAYAMALLALIGE